MRQLYICPRNIAEVAYRHAISYHFADLANGNVLLSVNFSSDRAQEKFERHVAAQPLPHLLDSTPIAPEHIEHVKHIGAKHGHTAKDLVRIARQKLHRLL